jgi:hypothetical protein
MIQLRKLFAWSLLIAGMLYSCDILQDDITPGGDELFNVDTDIRLLENSPFILDLGQAIQSVEDVKFQIGLQPNSGELEFVDETYLKYTPEDDMTASVDSFSIEMYNTNDELLDADTLMIEFIAEESDIPCLNGAMADYFYVEMGGRVEFDPVDNDGYCEDEVSEYEIYILVAPKNGAAEKVDGVHFVYEPDSGFVGYDYFVYGLEFVDNEGVSNYSAAIVEVEVKEDLEDDCRYDLFKLKKDFFIEDEELEDFYEIEIFKGEDDACETGEWTLDITEVMHGTAEPYDSQKAIKFIPSGENDSIDYIKYTVKFDDEFTMDGEVYIFYNEEQEENCAEAYFDHYQYFAIPDSVTSEVPVFIANPAENDEYCNENYELHILEQPQIGEASINDDKQLEYFFTEELAGDFEVTIKYEICNEGKCDFENVYIDVYQSFENCAEAYDDTYTYFAGTDSLTNDAYIFWMNPAENDEYCNENFELHVLEQPSFGEAETSEDGKTIQFVMSELPNQYTEVEIKYEICNEGKCDFAFIHLGIDIDGSTSACVEVEDDEYVYNAMPDSSTQEIEPFIFDPAENDSWCGEEYEIDITEAPGLGDAEVNADQKIVYEVEEEFEGQKETTLKYKLCSGGECEEATVHLTINK